MCKHAIDVHLGLNDRVKSLRDDHLADFELLADDGLNPLRICRIDVGAHHRTEHAIRKSSAADLLEVGNRLHDLYAVLLGGQYLAVGLTQRSQSRWGALLPLQGVLHPHNNGAILNTAKIIKNVMSSELGALYIMASEAIWIRTILEEMGHKQPPTPRSRPTTPPSQAHHQQHCPAETDQGHGQLASRPQLATNYATGAPAHST
ncbi:hypothetical protein THAOC_03313 [Thalassiosira oceanica]|uniref:Uncharacterized protein n=1 Tax=Thalassiosira oceanica TaxID=159749 RepID=K0TBV2_THAOC|nr:hypothetical protein THAOC_03313 [Thalassiosira oceanica]|eukprot:EJK74980.1 hypothetical protein THAOC_03313 [Thalassiosira oceanica]